MHVPRAPAVNNHLEPTYDGVRGPPRRSLRDVPRLEFGGSKAGAPECVAHLAGPHWHRARHQGHRRCAAAEDASTSGGGGGALGSGAWKWSHPSGRPAHRPPVSDRDDGGQHDGTEHQRGRSEGSPRPRRNVAHHPDDGALPSDHPHGCANPEEKDPRGGEPENQEEAKAVGERAVDDWANWTKEPGRR